MDYKDYMEEVKDELTRADHLIFVSLKYTRTVDVIIHILQRFIDALDKIFYALLSHLEENGKIDSIPLAPIQRANLVKKQFPDDEFIIEFCNYFLRLRKLTKLRYSKECEFRRHVAMRNENPEDEEFVFNIDVVTEDFHKLKEFFTHILTLIPLEDK